MCNLHVTINAINGGPSGWYKINHNGELLGNRSHKGVRSFQYGANHASVAAFVRKFLRANLTWKD